MNPTPPGIDPATGMRYSAGADPMEGSATPEQLPEAMYEGERYVWTCHDCGWNEVVEIDPRGDIVVCPGCSLRQRVSQ